MKQTYLILSMLLITAISFLLKAQGGTLDLSLNPGTGIINGYIYSTAIQNDGKIIIAGNFRSYNGTTRNSIARLGTDGTLDETFNPGIGVADGFNIYTTAIQSNGKIIIGGVFTAYNGTARNRIARLNADGTLDETFNPGTGANTTIYTTAIQSDGKIIIGGNFNTYNGMTSNYIARLNADGTLDATFSHGTGANSTIYTTAIQSDGKIILGGNFNAFDGITRNKIARLNVDGTLDDTFNPGNGANDYINTTAIQSDGKIIITGFFNFYNSTPINYITRLNANGTLDVTFNTGTGPNNIMNSTAIQSDGKIIIAGAFTAYNETTRNSIARLNADGTLDGTFDPGTGANGSINTAAIQSNGKIVIGGNFTLYNGTSRNKIARIIGTIATSVNSIQTTSTIYPNPVTNVLVIEINGNKENTNLEIINSIGQVVFNDNFTKKTTVETNNFTPGAYFIKLENGKNFEIKKIIKE